MANLTNFTEIIYAGLNNPDCAFFTGAFAGQFIGIKIVFWLAVFYIVVRAIDKVAIAPFFDWLKNKIWRRKQ